MKKITSKILKDIYKDRPKTAHKYEYGILLIIGGSRFYSGSPAFAGMAAFRAGVDMVHIIAPERAANIIASFSPNLAAYPLEGKYLNREKHLSTLVAQTKFAQEVSNGKTAVVIGGGIGRGEEVQEAILEYLNQVSVPVVVDADAIHAVAKQPESIFGKDFLVAPHTHEFSVLTGKEISGKSQKEKIEIVKDQADRLRTTILLKGATDIIAKAGEDVVLNEIGSPYMTVGGTGDVLAGICGGLIAQGKDVFTAAKAAAYINGKAGQLAAKKLKHSLTATDLIRFIFKVR